MTGEWNQLSVLDQWRVILLAELRRGKRSSDFLSCDLSEVSDSLRELLRSSPRIDSRSTDRPVDVSPRDFFQAHYKSILRQAPLCTWQGLLSAIRKEQLPLTARETQNLERLSALWADLESSDRRARLEAIHPFVEALASTLGWEIVKRESVDSETVYYLTTNRLKLKLGRRLFLFVTFVFHDADSAERALRWTRDLLGRVSGSTAADIGINIVVGAGNESTKYKEGLTRDKLIWFDESVLKEILSSERHVAKVEEVIKKSMSLDRLNPYKPTGPVGNPEMFFGRDEETRTILDNQSRDFAVLGARQIGKSSLLFYLRDIATRSINRTPVFLDCSLVFVPDQLARAIAIQVNPRRAERILISHVAQMVKAAYSVHRTPFLFLLDEADQLVRFARENSDWTFLHVMRSLSADGYCQTIMTGHKVLFNAWQDRSTPLFNFVQPLYLSVLSKESARQLVTAPMKDLGVEFMEPSLVDQIVDESGCHPSFLQFFCGGLLAVLAHNGSKIVTPTEMNEVRVKSDYRHFVMKPFGSDADFSLFERWLVLALAGANRQSFNARDIMDGFCQREHWLTSIEVGKALLNLELAGLIREEGRPLDTSPGSREVMYTWTIPAFLRMLEITADIGRQTRELRGQLAAGRKTSEETKK